MVESLISTVSSQADAFNIYYIILEKLLQYKGNNKCSTPNLDFCSFAYFGKVIPYHLVGISCESISHFQFQHAIKMIRFQETLAIKLVSILFVGEEIYQNHGKFVQKDPVQSKHKEFTYS